MKYAALLLVFLVHGVIVFYFLDHRKELPLNADQASFFTVVLLPPDKKQGVVPAMQSYVRIDVVRLPAVKGFIPGHEKFVIDGTGSLSDGTQAAKKTQGMVDDSMAPARVFKRDKIDLASIDKELRAGKPGVPKERPDTPQRRLERGIADAFVGYSESVTDHYMSPDGVVYTRTTKNGRSSCFMSGGSNVIPSAIRNGAGGSGVKAVNCPPPDSGWEK